MARKNASELKKHTTPANLTSVIAEKRTRKVVSLNQTFDSKTYDRLTKYKSDKGMLREQDAVRIAVGYFLEQVGY